MMTSSREDREATTFWMDSATKVRAKEIARELDSTLTDLINQSVAYYIQNLPEIDQEYGQKRTMAEITREVRDKPQIDQLKKEISQMRERIDALEEKLEDVESGAQLNRKIRTQVSAILEPVVERISLLLKRSGLDSEEDSEDEK